MKTKKVFKECNKSKKKVNKTPDKVTPAPTDGNQFKMKFHTSCHIFLSLLFLLQFSDGGEPGDIALVMQRNVEHLIEKILLHVEEYYKNVKGEVKCIPDYIPDQLIEILKKSIDCVHVNEKYYVSGKITTKVHLKNFLNCFSIAKKKVEETMREIDPSLDHCPNNTTEKTYQINVTTTFTKTFHINIKNGLEVTHHKIDFSKDSIDTFDHNLTISDNNNNSTEWESTEGYDINYSSSENNYKGQDLDDPINLLTDEENNTEGNFTEQVSEEEPKPERQFRNSDRKESEEESEENSYYDMENDRRSESESSDEYSYEDDGGNGGETKEYFEKIKPQIKNTEIFMAAEKHVQPETI